MLILHLHQVGAVVLAIFSRLGMIHLLALEVQTAQVDNSCVQPARLTQQAPR